MSLVTDELTGPHGVALSPDERFLYVGNWDADRKVVMRPHQRTRIRGKELVMTNTLPTTRLVAGPVLPDFELPDHTGDLRRLSDLQTGDPMVLLLSRGKHCPRQQHHRELLEFWEWCQVAFTRMATVAANDLHDRASFRISMAAPRPFLSDADRTVQRALGIQEYTDPFHDPLVPPTLVLAPGLVIDEVYVGYRFWGRPSAYDLWADLRDLHRRIKPDFDRTLEDVRSQWERMHLAW